MLRVLLDYKSMKDSDNVTKQQVNKNYEIYCKLRTIANTIYSYCLENKNYMESTKYVCENVLKMIENKESINDTLLMITAKILPEKFVKALTKAINESINNSNARDAIWFKECILTSMALSLPIDNNTDNNNNYKDNDGAMVAIPTRQRATARTRAVTATTTTIGNTATADTKTQNATDAHINISTSQWLLFDTIEKDSVKEELFKQKVFIKKNMDNMKMEYPNELEALINFRPFQLGDSGNLTQMNLVHTDNISMSECKVEGISAEYRETEMIYDHISGFNSSAEYDNNLFLLNLLIQAYKMNLTFQHDCANVLNSESLGVKCEFISGAVKPMVSCQVKASLKYSQQDDKNWPYQQYILDFLRCSVLFDNVKDLLNGLNKFKNIIDLPTIDGSGAKTNSKKGCILSIVRIKNMFANINNWHEINDFNYCDVKVNCCIKVKNKYMYGEIQFILKFMQDTKNTGDIF